MEVSLAHACTMPYRGARKTNLCASVREWQFAANSALSKHYEHMKTFLSDASTFKSSSTRKLDGVLALEWRTDSYIAVPAAALTILLFVHKTTCATHRCAKLVS